MGSYEQIAKLEEAKKRYDDGDLLSAEKVIRTLDVRKIKHLTDLNLIAMIYAENENYEEAAEIYLKIYDKAKSRKALFQYIEMLIKLNNVEDAEQYLNQYQKIAPKDFYNYVFRYKIDKLKGEPYEKLIEILEELKKTEYTEKWAYELAKLYYKAGKEEECIKECSEIELWFGEGIYVEKARMLKAYYSGATDRDNIMEEIKRRAEEVRLNQDEYTVENKNQVQTEEQPLQEASQEENQEVIQKDSILGEAQEQLETTEEIEDTQHLDQDYLVEELKNDVVSIMLEEEGQVYPSEEEVSAEDNMNLDQLAELYQFQPEEIFGSFITIPEIKSQLAKSIEYICNDESRTPMLMITGLRESGKTTLAKNMALFLFQIGKLNSSKMAKISAEKLNEIDLRTKTVTLKDCCLVVENASLLKKRAIGNLLEFEETMRGSIAIIFEEDKINSNKLFEEHPKLVNLMKNQIHLS
ncbi:MAG: hypothetical protein K0R00_574 [Herbinix sp.]|jgi:tetratricopeptide (TPR) repeat protein|nr:hypothetical protein [Herbinix sp.]